MGSTWVPHFALASTMALPMKKAAMKAAMKKAMKKVMKKKKVSTIAKGKYAKAAVLSGRKAKTSGGLTASGLTKNKGGRVVSKAASARAKRNYQSSGIKVWADAVKKARKALGLTGFVAIGGKPAAGKALYAKAKSVLES